MVLPLSAVDRLATLERARQFATVFCVLPTVTAVVSLIAGFDRLSFHPVERIGWILPAAVVSPITLAVALVPTRRTTSWVSMITGPNCRWFFQILILLWSAGMAFL